jgi:hypothetical protein
MNEIDYGNVLEHMRRQMRSIGFGELDSRIVIAIQRDAGPPKAQLLRYLELLESEARLGTDSTARAITERLNHIARTDSGSPIEGISVALSQQEQVLFRTSRIDVGMAPDLAGVISQLRDLYSELADEPDATG